MDQKSNASESNANETICVNDNRKYFCHSCDKEIRITSEVCYLALYILIDVYKNVSFLYRTITAQLAIRDLLK